LTWLRLLPVLGVRIARLTRLAVKLLGLLGRRFLRSTRTERGGCEEKRDVDKDRRFHGGSH
jgi:hypothetical protein